MIRTILLAATLALAAMPALAQPKPPPAADPRQEAARIAFEALPEGDRKAIQDALVWTGYYNGVLDGSFGKRSFDAILAFETRMKLQPDGILQGPERTMLLAAGEQIRQTMRFAPVDDMRAGLRIGIPARLLTKVAPIPAGTSYRAEDGGIFLETRAYPPGTALPDLYAGLVADTPGRKITYKVLRPDWFVVTGEEGERTFYIRAAAVPDGVKGYTLNYRNARKELLSLAVAIANSFDPAAQVPRVAVTAPSAAASPPAGTASPPSAGAPAASRPALTALAVAPGRYVTDAAALKGCAAPRIGNVPVRITRTSGSLALLEGNGGRPIKLAIAPASPGPADVLVLSAAQAAGAPALVVTPGTVSAGSSGLLLRAALDNAAGAVAIDREGRLAGIVGQRTGAVRRIGDTALAATYPLSSGDAALTVAGASSQAMPAAQVTAGDIALKLKDALVVVDCP